ncbi:cytochrome P450 6a2-like [Cylas formicarius]|uniref:cytochrome P450 6a2-like n=1 Tax=Cylas formicarius TaxID=197179 RepID=UPI00295890AC|nr:cytochrome P450 6a2-like [Cylas formicarius]
MVLIVFLIPILSFVAYFYIKYRYSYWSKRGVTQIEPEFPYGNLKETILKRRTIDQNLTLLRNKFKQLNQKHGGIYLFSTPIWIPVSPDMIKNILQKDFHHFTDHYIYYDEKEVLTNNIFHMEGDKWKQMRTKLSPAFTSGKMKQMFDIVYALGQALEQLVDEMYSDSKKPFCIRETIACFSTDVIANCAFGLDPKCMENPDAELRVHGRKIFEPRNLKSFLEQFLPWKLLAFLGYTFLPSDSSKFFHEMVKNIVEFREKNHVHRNDFVHFLLQLKNKGRMLNDGDISKTNEGVITMNDLAASMFVIFAGGFETSATTTTFMLYELARNQDVQNKIREEIRNIVRNDPEGKLTYEGLQEMHYTQKCIDESLRMYPPSGLLLRKCTKTYKVPDSDAIIEKGTQVFVPVMAVQRDPDIYPDPDTFNPENFSEENKAKREQISWMPFGEGPRQCIGLRFGYMQVKIALAALLRNHRYTLNPLTPETFTYLVDSLSLATKEEIYLDVENVGAD